LKPAAAVPGVGRSRFVTCCYLAHLDSRLDLSQFSHAAPVQVPWLLLPASQAPASDHVVGTTCGRRGRDVRRFTPGEENDATEHKALTLLNRKVTAQLEVNSSC